MVTIRPYQTSDYDSLKRLLQEVHLYADTWESPENLESMVAANPTAILVGVEGLNVVSSIFSINYGSKVVFHFRLAVAPQHRNQGLASKMIATAEQHAREQGAIETCLFADAENAMLQHFYPKRGFVTGEHNYTCFWKELKEDSLL